MSREEKEQIIKQEQFSYSLQDEKRAVRIKYTHLEVWRGDALSQLPEERIHDLLELGGLDDVEYLLELVEEHDLLRRVRLRPELEKILNDRLRERGVLLQKLDDAVGELRVINRQRFSLVQRQKNF